MIRVGVIGGSGYTGGELLRLFAQHPKITVTVVTSRALDGEPISDTHHYLKGFYDLKFENIGPKEAADKADVVFLAVPHGAAMKLVPELIDRVKVIDLSADYRLGRSYEQVYGPHSDPRDAVYGLPELHPEVAEASLVANPGCYATGAIIAAAPFLKSGLVDRIIFDSKSGISGAGVVPTEMSHYPNLAENIRPYSITTHRHRAEIAQELGKMGKAKISCTPHVIPAIRGIMTTAHVFTSKDVDEEQVKSLYNEFYKNCPFIRYNIPSLASVRGTNFCDIYVEKDVGTDRVVVISTIDNMVKGASGQAIQNMNLMFGLDQRAGLWSPALSL